MAHVAPVKSQPAAICRFGGQHPHRSQYLPYVIVKRTFGALDHGTPWVEIEECIGAEVEGYARLRFFLLGHTGFALDGESYATEWPAVAATIGNAIASFRPRISAPPPVN